jgi:hypothetical protein
MLPRVVIERIWSSLSSYNPFRLSAVQRTVIASRLWFEVNRKYPYRDIRAAVDVAIQAGRAGSIVDGLREALSDPRVLPVDPRLGPGDPCYSYRTLLVYRSSDGQVIHTSAVNITSDKPMTREELLEQSHVGLRAGIGGTPVPPAVQRGSVTYSVASGDSQVLQAARNAHC